MTTTLLPKGDRRGHRGRTRRHIGLWTLIALALLASPARAASKDYSASRFDVSIKVQTGGDLRVDETVTFDFGSGPFTHVWRDIPTSRTDGIDIVQATMDGVVLPVGDGPGHITVSARNRVRVEWHFGPVESSKHTFGLSYIARGVAVSTSAGDEVAWKPLPIEHAYTIASGRIAIESPVTPEDSRILDSHRIETPPSVVAGDGVVNADLSDIRPNGWFTVSLRFPAHAVVTAQPQWRQHEEHLAALAPRWALAAGIVLVLSLVLVVAVRRSSPAPLPPPVESTVSSAPAPLAPAFAASLAANGRTPPASAMATLMNLAERGVLVIRELPRRFGVRQYELSTRPGSHDLAPHEEAAVTIAFAGGPDPVSLSKARARLVRGSRRFSSTVESELRSAGMLDEMRMSGARQLKTLALTLLVGGLVLVIPALVFIEQQGPWPLLVPLALVIAAVVAFIAWATLVVLSDQAVASAARWQGYKRHLKQMASGRGTDQPTVVPPRTLVYAVALWAGAAMVSISQASCVGRAAMVRVDRAGPVGCLGVLRILRVVRRRGGQCRQCGRWCRGRGRIRCRLKRDDCRNPPSAALTGNAGDHISATAPGRRSAKTTARTAPPGNSFRTITRDRVSTAGTRMVSPASAIAISTSASRSRSGIIATRSSRNACSA